MKKIIILLLLLPMLSFSQKIKVSEKDKFNKQYRIETNKVILKMGMTQGLSMSIRSVDTSILIGLQGYSIVSGGVNTDSKTIFLLSDESTLTIYSKDLQFTNGGAGKMEFEYKATLDIIEKLATAKVVSIRFHGSSTYTDIEIKDTNSKNINRLCSVFLKEYNSKKTQF